MYGKSWKKNEKESNVIDLESNNRQIHSLSGEGAQCMCAIESGSSLSILYSVRRSTAKIGQVTAVSSLGYSLQISSQTNYQLT